jgi:periplasmic protein TonB
MKQPDKRRHCLLAATVIAVAAFVAGCSAPPTASDSGARPVISMATPANFMQVSVADTPLAYRHDAAAHLYGKNSSRIYHGIMPPFLYAVAVLRVEVDSRGQVASMDWLREPVHAPEVAAEIERTVRQAAPFPAPVKLGRATYIDTWLWDVSGRFQLHTLTEGQSWDVTHSDPQSPAGAETVSGLGPIPDLLTK